MKHPFEVLEPGVRRRLYWFTFAATAGIALWMGGIARSFESKVDKGGTAYSVVAFEFAKTPDRAQHILDTWGEDGVRAAIRASWIDYLFMPMYSSLIALGVLAVVAGRAEPSLFLRAGRGLAWAQWLAALLDAVENVGLLIVLYGTVTAPWPQVAFYCAAVKFALIGLGTVFILLGLPMQFRDAEPAQRQ